MHENAGTNEIARAKRFINNTLQDFGNGYDWEFLRGMTSITATADGVYTIQPISQLNASSYIYFQIVEAADNGITVNVNGKYLNGDTIIPASGTVTVTYGATASANQYFHQLDNFTKNISTGSIIVTTATGGHIAILNAGSTYIANDIKKINSVICPGDNTFARFIDWNDQAKGNPDYQSTGGNKGYDIDYQTSIRVFNLPQTSALDIYYQRSPRYLIGNLDRTEFPRSMYQDIINYAYQIYGKPYEDEASILPDTSYFELKKALINEIIYKWTQGKDDKGRRVMPDWIKRTS